MGLGYTTPFLAQALYDSASDRVADMETLSNPHGNDYRRGELSEDYFLSDDKAVLHAIDDYSIEGSSASKVMDAMARLKLDDIAQVYDGDFRGMSKRMKSPLIARSRRSVSHGQHETFSHRIVAEDTQF